MTGEQIFDGALVQLRSVYGDSVADQLRAPMTPVELPHYRTVKDNEDRTMRYATVRSAQNDPSLIMYIPGFAERPVNKFSTAAELALQGADVILPYQDRGPLLTDPKTRRPDATYTQAMNMLAVARHAVQAETARTPDAKRRPLQLVAHSIGALALAKMVQIANQNGEGDLFRDSEVFLLAPAGLRDHENLPSVAVRWARYAWSLTRPHFMTYPDVDGLTGKASLETIKENKSRAFAELEDLATKKIDLESLANYVDSVNVLTYKEDKMYPPMGFLPAIRRSLHLNRKTGLPLEPKSGEAPAEPARISWVSPVLFTETYRGIGGSGAVHDDEQLAPPRVIGAIMALMQQRKIERQRAA